MCNERQIKEEQMGNIRYNEMIIIGKEKVAS